MDGDRSPTLIVLHFYLRARPWSLIFRAHALAVTFPLQIRRAFWILGAERSVVALSSDEPSWARKARAGGEGGGVGSGERDRRGAERGGCLAVAAEHAGGGDAAAAALRACRGRHATGRSGGGPRAGGRRIVCRHPRFHRRRRGSPAL